MRRRSSSKSSTAITLRSYAPSKPVRIPKGLITLDDVTAVPDASSVFRSRFGRGLSMDRIESSLVSANRGQMRDLTDISRETIDTDPHLGSILNKRMGAVSSLPWEVQPAEGIGVDREKATYYAEVVREQLSNLHMFRKNLNQIAWGLFDGRAVLEIGWSESDNTGIKHKKFKTPDLILDGLGWVHPRRISFDSQRHLIIEDEATAYTGGGFNAVGLDVNSIPYKFVQWTPQRFNEYQEREGLSPRCLYWSFFKRFTARDRMILVELFGKPWRVIEVDEESSAGDDELTQADLNAQGLGAAYSARMPRGTHLNVVQPGRTAGQVHQAVIEESDKQLSKLVLGQTGTTDGVPAGLNSSQANVMQDEQLMILKMDAAEIQEVIESQITDAIIALNFGPQELPYAPKFLLRSDLPADRSAELDRLDKALKSGLAISMTEAYEVSGFRVPPEDSVVVRMDQPPTPPLAPVAPAPRPILVYPPNTSPATGEQQPPAATASVEEGEVKTEVQDSGVVISITDVAKIVTVNEARASQGLPPLEGEEGNLTISQFEAMNTGKETEESVEEPPSEEVADIDEIEESETEEIVASTVTTTIKKEGNKWVVYSKDGSRSFGSYDTKEEAEARLKEIERFKKIENSKVYKSIVDKVGNEEIATILASASVDRLFDKHICSGSECDVCGSVGQKQPSTKLGSPENILIRGRHEIYRTMKNWISQYTDAVKNKKTVPEVMGAISDVSTNIDVSKLARPLERRMIQSLALGSLDSALDIGEDLGDLKAEQSDDHRVLLSYSIMLKDPEDFSSMKFEEAVRYFKSKGVLSPSAFKQLELAAKQRAFTVAGVQSRQLLTLIRDELTKTIASGADIREFRKFIEDRVKSAGFVPIKIAGPLGETLSAAHTDTVFRTNVLNAYNAGRAKHQTQPEVIVRRPVWQARAVVDKRTRSPHKDFNSKMLLATDTFWQTAYPPYGFNCRCRVITRSQKYLDQVVSGSTIHGLPDPGFSSGIGGLL